MNDANATDINVGASDTISRAKAIEALNKLSESTYEVDYGVIDCDDAIREIEQLPPAQPEIIRCKDCKHFKQVFAPNDNDGLCGHWHSKCDARTNRNGYCSHAERREETG